MECKIINAAYAGIKETVIIRILLPIVSIVLLIFAASTNTLLQISTSSALLPHNYHVKLVLNALHSEIFKSFLPILTVLPFSQSYVDDLKTKYIYFWLIRTSYKTYLFSRMVVCFVYGGFVSATGRGLALGIATLIFLPIEGIKEAELNALPQLVEMIILVSINGGLWAVWGMIGSIFMESKYIAFATPFSTYYLLLILCERYCPNAFFLYPSNWLNPDKWIYGTFSVAVFMLELTTICGLFFVIFAGRRLRKL